MSVDGYFVSSYKNSSVRRYVKPMNRSNSNLSARGNTPGPGAYRLYSEFGKYDFSDANAMQT